MSGSGVMRWLRIAYDDTVRALGLLGRPWTDLRAIKNTHVDVVKAVASQKNDMAKTIASMETIIQEFARLDARNAQQDAAIRDLRTSVEILERQLNIEAEQHDNSRPKPSTTVGREAGG